jgi:hypothetical protein
MMRVEHEYERGGALAYLAAWDVHRGQVIGRCEDTTGIEQFARLVEQVMTMEPYASADHVYWITDNGSSHRGQASVERMAKSWPTAQLRPPPPSAQTAGPTSLAPATTCPAGAWHPDASPNTVAIWTAWTAWTAWTVNAVAASPTARSQARNVLTGTRQGSGMNLDCRDCHASP